MAFQKEIWHLTHLIRKIEEFLSEIRIILNNNKIEIFKLYF